MAKAIRKEKEAIQLHHTILSKNTRAIPAMKITLATDVENAPWQKYFQDGMKLSSESGTEGSSSSDVESDEITNRQWTTEDGKMKKITKHVTEKTFYTQ